jgi:hypothetical protein
LQRVVVDVYTWLVPLVTINILWFVMCLTIVLMPPATAALYEVAVLATQGHSPEVQGFLLAVRRWLLKSWLWGAATLFLTLASILALSFYGTPRTALEALSFVISAAFVIFVWLVQFYFWPYVFLQEKPQILLAVRNAVLTVLADPVLLLINAGVALLLLAPSVVLIAPLVVITPVTIAFLGSYSLRDWLNHHGLAQDAKR